MAKTVHSSPKVCSTSLLHSCNWKVVGQPVTTLPRLSDTPWSGVDSSGQWNRDRSHKWYLKSGTWAPPSQQLSTNFSSFSWLQRRQSPGWFDKHPLTWVPEWTHGLGPSRVHTRAYQMALVVRNLPASAGDARDLGLTPGVGRSPGEGNGNPLQYSCLGNPMERGAW